MTLRQALARMGEEFKQAGLESGNADARLLVQGILGLTPEVLLAGDDRALSAAEEKALQEAAARRLRNEPVSRILGRRAFWKSDFKVTPATLDPRPDSETLIEAALHHVKNPLRILDLGTGTGCLLLSLLQEWPQATGVGLDISRGAVAIAEENAQNLQLTSRAEFIAADWNGFQAKETFDVIVSNPPYIALTEKKDLSPDVALYDPPQALFAGADGLDAYRSLVRVVPGLLNPGGYAFFEIGYRQKEPVSRLLADAGFPVLEVRRDLGGNDRVIVAKNP